MANPLYRRKTSNETRTDSKLKPNPGGRTGFKTVEPKISLNLLASILLLAVFIGSVISDSSIFRDSHIITSLGMVSYPSEIFIAVDSSKVIAVNNLSLGLMLDNEWKDWSDNSVHRELARNASFKLVRVFDWKSSSLQPVTYWNESTKTGTFNWTYVDLLVQRIFEIGAEPLFCFGSYSTDGPHIPSGMAVNPRTDLPYPESFAAYTSEWVKHFKAIGLPVRFYEVWNEPWTYFGWNPVNLTKLVNYMELFNAVATSMRQENPSLMISFDFICRKPVLDYWLANEGADVDFISFHKYDAWIVGQFSDAEMFARTESEYFGTWPLGYSVTEARQVWFNARGKLLPIINSESNFNSAWETGTDPKIQQMTGAIWLALTLRMAMLNGLSYNIYYSFSSSLSWGRKSTETGGAGFGMVNSDNNQPWYPYYVHHLLGKNLGVGDRLVNITSSSDDVRTIAWVHNETLNIFLICKVDQARRLHLRGVQSELIFFKVDNTILWETPNIQKGIINSTEPLGINGYTVLLLQTQTLP